MKKRTVIILLALGAIALAAFVVLRTVNEKTPDVVNKKPDVSTDITSLIAAFEKDTASARRKYIDRIVEISGNVKRVDTSGAVVMGTEGTASEVVVGFDRRHMDDLKKISPGSTVVLQGVCSGYTASGAADPEDLLADLGTTIQFRSAGLKDKN